MPSGTGEVRDGLQYTLDRVNTLLYLDCLGQLSDAHIPLTVTQGDMAETLGIRPDSLKRHLRSLGQAGVVTYHSVDTKDGSYQAFRPVELKDETPNTPAGWVRIYAQQNGGIVTPEGVASFYFDGLAEDAPQAERERFTYQVRRSLQHMSSIGEFSKVAPFDDLNKSSVRLEPRTFQRNLVGDLAAAFAAMQTPSREARAYGLDRGKLLTRNWRGITRLLDKVEIDNNYYRNRIASTK
jgi:hypothetical protein